MNAETCVIQEKVRARNMQNLSAGLHDSDAALWVLQAEGARAEDKQM
jgi:hypothetical protein